MMEPTGNLKFQRQGRIITSRVRRTRKNAHLVVYTGSTKGAKSKTRSVGPGIKTTTKTFCKNRQPRVALAFAVRQERTQTLTTNSFA